VLSQKKIKKVQRKLKNLNGRLRNGGVIEEIKVLEKNFDDLLESEEIWWAKKYKALWLKHGDKNSKFFHQQASQRKRRKWVIEFLMVME